MPVGPKACRWIVPKPFHRDDRQADGVQALLLAAAGLDLKTAANAVLMLVALGVALSNDAAVATAAGLPVIAVLAVEPLVRPPLIGAKHTWTCRLTCPSTLDARSPQVGGL